MTRFATFVVVLVICLVGLLVISITPTPSNNRKNTGNQENVNDKLERELREAAQKALDAIGSTRNLTDKRGDHDQHVFNTGLLRIHHKVLNDLLKDVAPDFYHEQLKNLMNDLMIPLNQPHRKAISKMVAYFSPKEFYVDFNAVVYGEYARELREALVAFLKADISDNRDVRAKIQDEQKQVEFIASKMVQYEVYVDPMARDRCLQENQDRKQTYNQIRDALKKMFLNILQNFQNVSDKIRDLRRGNRNTPSDPNSDL